MTVLTIESVTLWGLLQVFTTTLKSRSVIGQMSPKWELRRGDLPELLSSSFARMQGWPGWGYICKLSTCRIHVIVQIREIESDSKGHLRRRCDLRWHRNDFVFPPQLYLGKRCTRPHSFFHRKSPRLGDLLVAPRAAASQFLTYLLPQPSHASFITLNDQAPLIKSQSRVWRTERVRGSARGRNRSPSKWHYRGSLSPSS